MLHDVCQNKFTYENKHKHTNTSKYTIKKSFAYQYLTKAPFRNSHCPKYCHTVWIESDDSYCLLYAIN